MGRVLSGNVSADGVYRGLASLVTLGRYAKRAILVACDITILSVMLWLALCLRYGEFFVPPSWEFALLLTAAPLIGVTTFFQMGLYRMVTRFMGGRTINRIAVAMGLSIMFWAMLVFLSGIPGVPRLSLFIYGFLGTAGIWGSRQVAGTVLRAVGVPLPDKIGENRLPVLIYGAGRSGLELAGALERSDRYVPLGFIDKNPTLWGQYLGGYKVYRPERLPGLVDRHDVKEVLLALSDAPRHERAGLLRELEKLSVVVRMLPAFTDIASGRVTVNDLRPVEAADLLGREPVPPNAALMARAITGKSVLVTGAGGSIGSELVRQVLKLWPRRLVLLDASENALYEIDAVVTAILQTLVAPPDAIGKPRPDVVAVLGSVLNRPLLDEVLELNEIQTIYHAAAYKHVPIVERNVATGLTNNTYGTIILAAAAEAHKVERMVLISTDKAVRPSSIMGASKRLAEMALQARAAAKTGRTIFTMVRFGNVLDSSGSVVRRFRKQIAAGGPVTVTHPQMIRYFMSIPEAASLVIQAGAMATGGELFVLDMGEPVKIDDLARSMVRLMGLDVLDDAHPNGDIAIEYVGLRQGEKLREELLITETTAGTEHPRILTAREPFLPADDLERELADLGKAMASGEMAAIQAVLVRAVDGYRQRPDAIDPDDDGHTDWPPAVSHSVH